MADNPCIATEWGAMGEVLGFGFDDAAGLPSPVFNGIPVVDEASRSLYLLSSDLTEYLGSRDMRKKEATIILRREFVRFTQTCYCSGCSNQATPMISLVHPILSPCCSRPP